MRQWKRCGWMGLALVAAGCGSSSGKTPEVKNTPVQQAAKLESFAGCEDLEQYIEDSATTQMRASLESFKNGGGWGYGGPRTDGDNAGMPPTGAPMPAEDSAGRGGSNSGPQDSTGTNNQVEGVHEADFVQNDGTRIFVLSGPRLYIHRSWPAEQLARTASLEVEGWPQEMLLDKERNRLVITSQVYEQRPGRPTMTSGREAAPAIDCAGFGCGYYYGNTLKVTVVDVADLAAPKVVEQMYLPGGYLSARRVEGAVRLVLSDQFRWPEDVRFYPDFQQYGDDREELADSVDALIVKNEKLIREQTLDQWLPAGRRVDAQGNVTPLAYACTDFFHANAPTGLGFVSVLSMHLDAGAAGQAPTRTSVVTAPGEVYASKDALYMATPHWWWMPEVGQSDFTYLHKFDIREPGRAAYVGSGTLEGHINNQFSMDEHEGVLRVATTVNTRVVDMTNREWTRFESVNRVVTFREQDGTLAELGRTEDLAKGERIFSARFVGKKAYVVTFRQTDPLFTFDLSDPAHPRKVGELKIPGFSTYIHPVGDTHLLTLGEHRDETGGWQGRALKLTLFDVTDLANPKEAFTQVVGTMGSYSEALYQHKAFNYFPAKGLLAIPFTDWSYATSDYWSGFRSELRVFRVDTAAGFTPVGALSMKDVFQTVNDRGWNWYWSPTVRRSVMADDYVYAISDGGLRVAKVDALQTPLATSVFQPPTVP